MEFWYRTKYNLTSNDPRFLAATLEEIITDYWAHQYLADPNLKDEIEDEDFDLDEVVASMENNPDDWEAL